jgi:two-component system, sensor histidine kinase YesM
VNSLIKFILKFFRAMMHNTKIINKLIFTFILMVAIPTILLSILLFRRFEQLIQAEVFRLDEQLVSQYTDNINYKYNIYRNLLESITSDKLILNTFSNPKEKDINEIMRSSKAFTAEVDSLLIRQIKNEILNITFYSSYEQFPSDGRYISNIGKVKEEPWYQKLTSGQFADFFYVTQGMKRNVVSVYRPLMELSGKKISNNLGIVKLDIYADFFFKSETSQEPKQFKELYVLNGYNDLIYGSSSDKPALSESIWSAVNNRSSGTQVLDYKNDKCYIVYTKFNIQGWVGIFIFDYNQIDLKVKVIRDFIQLTVLVILAIFIIIALLISRAFSNRIVLLKRKMHVVEKGDFAISEIIDGKDEISEIDRHFNQMVGKLNNLISEVYVKEIEKKKAEIKALQFQINPHFLNNTLQLVSSMASVKQCHEISLINRKLGEILRYNIDTDNDLNVTLQCELDHIKNYLYIQKMRFGDQFEVFYDIPDDLLNCQIIKFILQPIVENVFCHAMNGIHKTLCIEISAKKADKALIISVQDNGSGMTDEEVIAVNREINENSEFHFKKTETDKNHNQVSNIGLKNVSKRIKLAYSDACSLVITSEKHKGTKVDISIQNYFTGD